MPYNEQTTAKLASTSPRKPVAMTSPMSYVYSHKSMLLYQEDYDLIQ